jgi:hypothetical protein
VRHQRAATGLAAGELAQLALDRGELAVERSIIPSATPIRSRAASGSSSASRKARP